MKCINLLPILLFLVVSGVLTPVYGDGATLKELEEELYCMCGCVKILAYCEMNNCSVSVEMRRMISDMLSQGYSKEEIIEMMKKIYGDEVVAVPPKYGFSLAVWLYPLIGGGIGLTILYLLLKRRKEVVWHGEPEELLERGEEIVEEYEDYDEYYERILEEELRKLDEEEE